MLLKRQVSYWMNSMKNTIDDYIQSFFNIYLRYAEAELPSSMLENSVVGRGIDALILFQDTFILLMTAKKEGEIINKPKIVSLFEKLGTTVAAYIEEAQFKPQGQLTIKKTSIYILDDASNEENNQEIKLVPLLKEYQTAYRDFLQYLPRLKLADEILGRFQIHEECNVLVQAILEFNNALAHIANALYRNNEDQLHNIKKAKNHLYRAILDYYKMLLRFMMPNIRIQKLLETYRKLRLDEFLLLGEDIANKLENGQTITNRYKELFNECLVESSQA